MSRISFAEELESADQIRDVARLASNSSPRMAAALG